MALQDGITQITLLADRGTASSLGTGATTPTITLGSGTTTGTLQYIGSANSSTNRPLQLLGTSGGGTLDSSGVGTMSFTSATMGTPGAGIKTFTFTGSNTGANTFASVINSNSGTNTAAVTKSGAGTWVLTGANNYNGGTSVTDGTLRVDNTTGSGTGTGAVTATGTGAAGSGGTLGGTGTINGTVAISSTSAGSQGGTVAPGDSVGTLNTRAFTFNPNASYAVEISSAVARPGGPASNVNTNDVVRVNPGTGALTFANTVSAPLKINISGAGQTFAGGKTYDYFIGSADSISGFDSAAITVTPSNFTTSGTFSTFTQGGFFVVSFQPVPEPASVLAVFLASTAGVGWWRRRRTMANAA